MVVSVFDNTLESDTALEIRPEEEEEEEDDDDDGDVVAANGNDLEIVVYLRMMVGFRNAINDNGIRLVEIASQIMVNDDFIISNSNGSTTKRNRNQANSFFWGVSTETFFSLPFFFWLPQYWLGLLSFQSMSFSSLEVGTMPANIDDDSPPTMLILFCVLSLLSSRSSTRRRIPLGMMVVYFGRYQTSLPPSHTQLHYGTVVVVTER